MELLPPKLRVLPQSYNQWCTVPGQEKVWDVDSTSLAGSLCLAYLFSIADKSDKNDLICKAFRLSGKYKRWFYAYNPFKNRHAIFSDFGFKSMLKIMKAKLHAMIDFPRQKDISSSLLEAAANMFNCVVLVYNIDVFGNCELLHVYKSRSDSIDDSIKIFVFKKTGNSINTGLSNAKFGLGLSLAHSQLLRHDAIIHILTTAKLPEEKIHEIKRTDFSELNFLKCVFNGGYEDILVSIYKSSYLVSRISEAGFDTDPCSLDENELSSFCYCMGLSKGNYLNILYNFATNKLFLTDSSGSDPDLNSLRALEKVKKVIFNDNLKSHEFQSLGERKDVAMKRCEEILSFNKYQRQVSKRVYDIKTQQLGIGGHQQIMLSILETYRGFLRFQSPGDNQELFADDLKSFENFVTYSEYHENVDVFNCLLFFENFSTLIPLITTNNSNIFINIISSLYLSVLSNETFPTYKHQIHCTDCELLANDCEQNLNNRRFIPFHYRTCFISEAEKFTQYLLTFPASHQDKNISVSLLDFLRTSLTNYPEIVDEFLVIRCGIYLEVAKKVQFQDNPVKIMLIMERTLQVLGEIFGNNTVSKSVVKTLMQSCIPEELVNKLCCIRDNTFSHYRKNAVNGRLMIEKDYQVAIDIREEMFTLYFAFEPVFTSHIFRVKEFLTKKVSAVSCNKFDRIHNEMNTQIQELIITRKPKCDEQNVNLEFLLHNILKVNFDYLETRENFLSKEAQTYLETAYFLLSFIIRHYDSSSSDELMSSANELKVILKSVKSSIQLTNDQIDEIKRKVESHLEIQESKFKFSSEKTLSCIDFPRIIELNDKIKGFKDFSAKERKKIELRVSKYVTESTNLLKEFKEKLQQDGINSNLNTDDLENMILPDNIRSGLANEISKKTRKGVNWALNKLKGEAEIKISELFPIVKLDDILEPFKEKDELMSMLLKINFPGIIRNKIIRNLNMKLLFLIDRIDNLKSILILEDDNLRHLWKSRKWKRDATVKKHIHFVMVQRFLRENDVQTSSEMLLFDCMNVLENRKDLKDLWEKTNDLFKGANIADFLAHGNPILQTIGAILREEDLPSEFIDKIMELIKDVEAMRALSEMWVKTKLFKESKFFAAVESDKQDQHTDLRKRIKKCSRWKEYASLLPLKR